MIMNLIGFIGIQPTLSEIYWLYKNISYNEMTARQQNAVISYLLMTCDVKLHLTERHN